MTEPNNEPKPKTVEDFKQQLAYENGYNDFEHLMQWEKHEPVIDRLLELLILQERNRAIDEAFNAVTVNTPYIRTKHGEILGIDTEAVLSLKPQIKKNLEV